MRRTIRVAEGADELTSLAAERFAGWAAEAIAARGEFRVALSGGRTPQALFRRVRELYKARVDWAKAWFYWGDERCVPPDHPDSNYGMARRELLDGLGALEARVRRMEGERPPDEGARRYEDLLRADFSLRPGQRPRFDLALMGLGTNGHTASLFPGSPMLEERERLAVGGWIEAAKGDRITLTFPVFDAAARVFFVVSGDEKAEMARRAIEGSDPPVPAGRVKPRDGELYWLLDRAAAAKLSGPRVSGRD